MKRPPRREFPDDTPIPRNKLERKTLIEPIVLTFVLSVGILIGVTGLQLHTITSCMVKHVIVIDDITYRCMTDADLRRYQILTQLIPKEENLGQWDYYTDDPEAPHEDDIPKLFIYPEQVDPTPPELRTQPEGRVL